jgi:hypothetical protein
VVGCGQRGTGSADDRPGRASGMGPETRAEHQEGALYPQAEQCALVTNPITGLR